MYEGNRDKSTRLARFRASEHYEEKCHFSFVLWSLCTHHFNVIKALVRRLPPIRRLLEERDALRAARHRLWCEREECRLEMERYRTWVPPGHFYSPIPDREEVGRRAEELFENLPQQLPALDLNQSGQLDHLERLAAILAEAPWSPEPREELRYRYENINFSYGDALALYGMLRHYRPRRVIEIGSGWSTAVTLDTAERFLGGEIALTCIEPHPETLLEVLRADDRERIELIEQPLQAVGPERFARLAAGDILFIDSTHVAKIGSDVNRLFFEVLPCLAAGVIVHFHDIFYPFEYRRDWILEEGRAWNEAYVLRAFLQYNRAFRIVFFNDYLRRFHADRLEKLPYFARNAGGSIWLEKTV